MKKIIQVVRLPTEDRTELILSKIPSQPHKLFYSYNDDIKVELKSNSSYQHLYFISDEKIKEGDFAYDKNTNSIYKVGKFTSKAGHEGHSIKPLKSDVKEGEFYTYIGEHYSQYSRKIITTTDKSLLINWSGYEEFIARPISAIVYLPQIPQSLVEEYVKQGGIDEVELEYFESAISSGQLD